MSDFILKIVSLSGFGAFRMSGLEGGSGAHLPS